MTAAAEGSRGTGHSMVAMGGLIDGREVFVQDDPAAPLRLDATVIPGYTGGLRRGIADPPPARVPP